MGTRAVRGGVKLLLKDHPHAYGDKLGLIYGISLIIGSSPRVWGQDFNLLYAQNFFRIIPTRMGTSTAVVKAYPITWDHPHAYGDKDKVKKAGFTNAGSSPRVWGQD